MQSALHLRSLELRADRTGTAFPFTVPAVQTLPRVQLSTPVTFFVGDNGSGKSTLLEAIAAVAEAVHDSGQFIIATHSPILLAYPGASIYSFDSLPIASVRYDELEHVTLTREFLNGPDAFLRRLMPDRSPS